MANPTQTAMAASRTVHKTLMGVSITISDGVTTSDAITATVGFSSDVVYDTDGTTMYTRNRDYIVDVADYNVGGAVIEPAKHHVITEVVDGTALTFDVVEDSGDSVAAYEDTKARKFWRILTKEK